MNIKELFSVCALQHETRRVEHILSATCGTRLEWLMDKQAWSDESRCVTIRKWHFNCIASRCLFLRATRMFSRHFEWIKRGRPWWTKNRRTTPRGFTLWDRMLSNIDTSNGFSLRYEDEPFAGWLILLWVRGEEGSRHTAIRLFG